VIEQELLLLGLLKESPRHGYEIKKKIREILSLFAGIELKSIYYPLNLFKKKGLIVKRLSKRGKRPQRIIYALTAKGQNRFYELLTKSFLNFKRPRFSLDLSLYFLHYIEPNIVRRRLRARQIILKKISNGLGQMIKSLRNKKPSSLVYILEHNLQMVETEYNFLSNLIKRI
jgi:DNA-binding PadR family transcriptional regulator